MPLKLVPPRPGRSKNYFIRGTYLGRTVCESTGTQRRAVAQALLRKREAELERGALATAPAPGFAGAAASYMMAGGDRRRLAPLIKHFGNIPLEEIDQAAIDEAATALKPAAGAPTRNREVYTPISAVLKHTGIEKKIRRPKGWRGKRSTRWFTPAEAFALFATADAIDREFGIFLRFLCYTGARLSEAIRLRIRDVNLDLATAYIAETKTGVDRPAHLPPVLIASIANHPLGLARGADDPLFRFRPGGRLYNLWKETKAKAGIALPPREGGFHAWCHTWATWMKHHADLEDRELVDTGRWKDIASVGRYGHLIPSEASRRADLLPVEKRRRTK